MSHAVGQGLLREYVYEVFPITFGDDGVPLVVRGDIYIFSKWENGRYTQIYIGQTKDPTDRLSSHERMPCIRGYGATHILIRRNENRDTRLAEEAELFIWGNPPCNRQ